MISHGQIINAAFYNYTKLTDLEVIDAMFKDVAGHWDFKGTVIRINKTVTIDNNPFSFDVELTNKADLKSFDFKELAEDKDLLKFAISVENTLIVPSVKNCLNAYISFLFDNTYAPSKVLSTIIGLNEISNPYFSTYRYGNAKSVFGSFPLAGAFPSPLMGCVGGKLVIGVTLPNTHNLNVDLHTFGETIAAGKGNEVLKLWRARCLNDSVAIIDSGLTKTHPRNSSDLLVPRGSFTLINSSIVDVISGFPEGYEKNYGKINRYNDMLKIIYSEAVEQINKIEIQGT